MAKVDFKLNGRGVAALMKSKNMQSVLTKHATKIKNKAGNGYEQDIYVGKNRANAMVWAESNTAKKDNSTKNTILKSVK